MCVPREEEKTAGARTLIQSSFASMAASDSEDQSDSEIHSLAISSSPEDQETLSDVEFIDDTSSDEVSDATSNHDRDQATPTDEELEVAQELLALQTMVIIKLTHAHRLN